MEEDSLIAKTEDMLKQFDALAQNESIYDFLSKNYSELYPPIQLALKSQREFLMPIPDVQSDRLFFYSTWLISLSDALFLINQKSNNSIVKSNSDLLRKDIIVKVISELSPYLVSLFKWDLDRRNWKHDKDKFAYLKRVIEELDEELKGQRDNLVKKYVSLLIDYFISVLDKGLINGSDKDFEILKITKEKISETRNQLKDFLGSEKLNEFIDADIETSALLIYKPIAQSFLEGMIKSTKRWDYLVTSFIEAQNDYKNLVSNIIENISNNEFSEIKKALLNRNINEFISIIHSIFASIPNELIKKTQEAYYHINIHVILKVIGCEIISEVSTNLGRIDSVIEFENLIYIIEYKLLDSDSALKQIEDKKYYERYLNRNKKICLLGISFDVLQRNIRKEYSFKEIN